MRKLLVAIMLLTTMGVGSAVAAPAPPKNTAPPTVAGAAREGRTLTASPGKWAGTQPITFTYQWRRCDSNGGSCSNIIGATAKTYTLASVDVGNSLRVRVRAANSAGASTAVSVPTAVVSSVPPKSVSLDSTRSIVVYGRTVLLNGTVSNGQPGESVTVTEHRLPAVGGIETHAVASVTTGADGSFSLAVRPLVHTLYKATAGKTNSNSVSIQVRPLVRLRAIGHHRFLVRALAGRSFVGTFASLQRWSHRRHHWVGVRRVFFRSAFAGISPTMTSRATFRTRLHARIRVVVPRSQVRPGYITGFSNAVRA